LTEKTRLCREDEARQRKRRNRGRSAAEEEAQQRKGRNRGRGAAEEEARQRKETAENAAEGKDRAYEGRRTVFELYQRGTAGEDRNCRDGGSEEEISLIRKKHRKDQEI
jgi:hypothetical protein